MSDDIEKKEVILKKNKGIPQVELSFGTGVRSYSYEVVLWLFEENEVREIASRTNKDNKGGHQYDFGDSVESLEGDDLHWEFHVSGTPGDDYWVTVRITQPNGDIENETFTYEDLEKMQFEYGIATFKIS